MADKNEDFKDQELVKRTEEAAAENIRRTAAQAALDKAQNPKTTRTR
ncbi:MAG: hypothetical protein ABL867_00010 [Rickettsiales bacterium]